MKKKSLEDLQEDLLKYVTNELLNYTDSWKEMGEKIVEDLSWHGINILWYLHKRNAVKLCVKMEELFDEFKDKFGDRYDMDCTCDECKVNKVEENKKKTIEDFENDFKEYSLIRLKGWDGIDELILQVLIHHYLHVFFTFDFEDSILMYFIISDFMEKFKKEHDGEYSFACSCCQEKIESKISQINDEGCGGF